MAPVLTACPECSNHVMARACSCPHCGLKLRSCTAKNLAVGAALMGLVASTGCINKSQDLYGVPDTADTSEPQDTDTGGDEAQTERKRPGRG